jgi:hypothetical protein
MMLKMLIMLMMLKSLKIVRLKSLLQHIANNANDVLIYHLFSKAIQFNHLFFNFEGTVNDVLKVITVSLKP